STARRCSTKKWCSSTSSRLSEKISCRPVDDRYKGKRSRIDDKVRRMTPTRKLLRPYAVTDGSRFRLKTVNPRDTGGMKSKDAAQEALADDLERMRTLQEKLYARGTWSLLLIFQAMDAAGKDSTIKHVMSGVDPQGCEVHSFKAPSS